MHRISEEYKKGFRAGVKFASSEKYQEILKSKEIFKAKTREYFKNNKKDDSK